LPLLKFQPHTYADNEAAGVAALYFLSASWDEAPLLLCVQVWCVVLLF